MAEQEEQVQNQVEEAEKAKKEAEKEARKAEREAKKKAHDDLLKKSKEQLDKAIKSGKNKKTVPLDNIAVKEVTKDEKFDVKINCQRQADQWDRAKKSQFILSILTGKDLSEIIVYKKPDENETDVKYAVIDGKQRITTLRDFLNNELVLKLGSKEEPHYLDGRKFSKVIDENGNTIFEGLEEDYQDIIRNRELRIEELINYTVDEAEEQFKLKNSGVAVNLSQILKLDIKEDRADKLKALVEDEVTEKFKIGKKAKSRDVVRDVIIKSILLINNPDIASFSTKDIYNELNKLENKEFNAACKKLEKAFAVIRKNIKGVQSWLKPTSIPFIMYALANGADYGTVADVFLKEEKEKEKEKEKKKEEKTFGEASQKGTSTKASIQARRAIMDTLIK